MGSVQSATVGSAFSSPLVALVTEGGSPATGVAVTFTGPLASEGVFMNGTVTETDTTNVNGVATSTTFTAGATAGVYTVTASATGAPTPASFSLTNTVGMAATIVATEGALQ